MYLNDIHLNFWILQTHEEVEGAIYRGMKVVVADEEMPMELLGSPVILAPFLLPSPECFSILLSGDVARYNRGVYMGMSSEEAQAGLASIICALINDIPVALYSDEKNDFSPQILASLAEYLYKVHGIVAGHFRPFLNEPPRECGIMLADHIGMNMKFLLFNQLLTADEFLLVYKDPFEPDTINRLIMELRPNVPDGNYVGYFEWLRSSYQNANKILVDPMEFK